MLPAWSSACCCSLTEACVPCEPARALFAIWSIGGGRDHAGKLQSSSGRPSQYSLARPGTELFVAGPTDIAFISRLRVYRLIGSCGGPLRPYGKYTRIPTIESDRPIRLVRTKRIDVEKSASHHVSQGEIDGDSGLEILSIRSVGGRARFRCES